MVHLRGRIKTQEFHKVLTQTWVELIQKAAVMGCGLIAAISAPTELAIAEAQAAGITLVAVVRGEGFEIFTHPARIAGADTAPVGHRASGEVRPRSA